MSYVCDGRKPVGHTLSPADIAAVLRCRGDSNRLGYALMLCYLRYPGRALLVSTQPIDFRKVVQGLVALVAEGMKSDPHICVGRGYVSAWSRSR